MTAHATWLINHPWYWNYSAARARCKPAGKYGKRGIKFELSIKQVEYIWFRDKAYLMNKPSIDRIDTTGNYDLKNTQFLELKDNQLKPKHYAEGWRDYSKMKHPNPQIRAYTFYCVCGAVENIVRKGYGGVLKKECRKCQKRKAYLKRRAQNEHT